VQAAVFWLTGGAFFALQLGMLLYLLYAGPRTGLVAGEARRRRVEMVWTLVPAALLVAVVLMVAGLTGSSWSRVRATAEASGPDVRHAPLAVRTVHLGVGS